MPKSIFICQNCGAIHTKWSGKCNECGEWNTITEEREEGGLITNNTDISKTLTSGKDIVFENLDKEITETPRYDTGINELNRVLGGGLVTGSVVLIGGDPGIGKSTLLLQTLCSLVNLGLNALYISGEESVNQVKIRAQRLQLSKTNLKVASATCINDIIKALLKEQPQIVVIDSIQTIFNHYIEFQM